MSRKRELTTDEIKYLTGWDDITFKLHLTEGLNRAHTDNDLYDARQFVLWYRDNIMRPQLAGDGEETIDLDVISHRARYEKARAQKYQIKLERLRSQYVSLADAKFALMELCDVVGELIAFLPKQLSKIVYGKKEDEMLVLTDQFIRGILLKYSKLGVDNARS